MRKLFNNYKKNLSETLGKLEVEKVEELCQLILSTWKTNNTIYLCGNGGSAANAIHVANDMIYGAGKKNGKGISIEALTSNSAVLTCLANDLSYEDIFSEQIRAKGKSKDLLIVFSGSGNSKNVIKAIEIAKNKKMKTFAVVGFDGGKCKKIADHSIHLNINDMQVAEDFQLIVSHMCMQWLSKQKIN
ncbi:SIS domain-containing protein [Candidatus Pelagibacter sp.]|nr:SIS domain-containing protein [Candidatus Pelagibacter sp.]